MQYFDDMRTKFGFGDGASVPAGIEAYRDVYIKALNALGQENGSELTAYAYDRAGMHNWCLILFKKGESEDCSPDDGMEKAIAKCRELDLDSFVEVTAVADMESLEDFLTNLE